MRKRQPRHYPKLEAALDELDAALTADAISKILEDVPKKEEPAAGEPELLPPVEPLGRRGKRRR